MRVIITGGTGLIGRSLVEVLARHRNEIVVLSREPAKAARAFRRQGEMDVQVVGWDGRTAQGWGDLVTRECAIVNLAGASPAHWRWTKAYRARIRESRLHAGAAVMEAISRYGPPDVLVQASAAGYYGNRGQEILTEASAPGMGFRAEVCQEWEESTARATARRCMLRTGIVLDVHAGALPPLLLFAHLCGSRLGDGQQWVPWMHKRDVARAIQFLIEDRAQSGPFNLCAPEPTTNREFLRVARHVLKRMPVFPLSAFALQTLLGEMSSVVLDSERVLPRSLVDANFHFEYPRLDEALRHLLREA
ncbi:MAG TPA: TIGR01777 family oxidoreductase [Ktedonobacterales bacterium]